MRNTFWPPRISRRRLPRFVRSRKTRTYLAGVLALGLLTAAAIFSSPTASAAQFSVGIQNVQFNPNTLTINVGDTVTWTNNETDGTVHSSTSDDGVWNSPDMAPGSQFSFTFTTAGTFNYHCRFHPAATGTITVNGGGNPPPPTTTTAPPPPPSSTTAPPPTTTSTSGTPPTSTTAPPPGGGDGNGNGADLGDGTRLATYQIDNGVKVFHLRLSPISWEVSPGVIKQAYAFNGIVPGPVIRVNQFDRVRIIVQNDLPEMTSIHWHGMELPNDQDGVPELTQPPIQPGQSYTYEWTALSTGTHWYHSHMGGDQEGKGVYAPLEVVPRAGDILANRDYRLMVGDGFLGFTWNGKSFPGTTPLKAKVGDIVRIRLIGTGPEMIHPIHLHGGNFTVIAQDGNSIFPYAADTVNVGVGQTYDIIVIPKQPGRWMLHCHIFSHSETTHGMAGIVTTLDVAPAPIIGGIPAPALPALPTPSLPSIPGLPPLPLPQLAPILGRTT